jgi:nucleoside-diphosphate-sugar epimerase
LSKNNSGIEVLALRPRAIIGEGDTTIFPRLLKAHKSKNLRRIGKGNVVCDLTCVGNVIHAIDKSISAGIDALGKAYNITDGMPVRLWDSINYVLAQLGHDTINKSIPFAIVSGYAAAMEWKYKLFNSDSEPPLTRFGIGVLGKSMTMNIDLARQLLGYNPVQTTQEGIDEFIAWYKKNEL